MASPFPTWTMVPFAVLVLGIALFPLIIPRVWNRHTFQVLVTLACSGPVVVFLWGAGHADALRESTLSYLSFAITIGALYITASGIFVAGDIKAEPKVNLAFLLGGALLASLVGTTGASILLIRPLLRTNSQRQRKNHLVPFFILAVSNAGGMLTPLGDPPLLLGYLEGVPFLWTLGLFPYWLLYVGLICAAFYVVEVRAYAAESLVAKQTDAAQVVPIGVQGKANALLMLSIVGAVLLPAGLREVAMGAIAALSYLTTAARVHQQNGFSFGPIVEVAVLFAGLFACLVPLEHNLALAAPTLPLRHAWQLFWGAGALSAVLDNAPTYAAFTALARGLGGPGVLVAGIEPIKLAAVSVGSVVMGATTYIGNGPNLMVKAIAEGAGYAMPSFARYALFALIVLLPIHLVATAIFVFLDP